MKLALCSIASKYVHCTLAPLSLAAGVAAYAQTPVDCHVLEHTINAPDSRLLEAIYEAHADVVGFCCYIWNIETVERMVRVLRRVLPHVVILLGGPEVSSCPQQVLDRLPEVDYILCGEGEESLPRLLDALARGERPPAILPAVPLTALPPTPWTPQALAALDGRIAYLETSRGCPFSCAFCLSGKGSNVRFLDQERAEAELLLLANSGSRTVKLVDRTFNCNPQRAVGLWRFLLDAHREGSIPPGVCFHFEIGADLLDDQALELLATAPPGLFQLEAGIQSFYPQTLAAVNRVTDVARLEHNLSHLLAGGNLHLHIDLIAGLPQEDLAEFARSFDRAFALRPHALQLGFLKLLHGSRLRDEAQTLGLVYDPAPPYEVLSTPWMSYGDLLTLKAAEDALERLYNSGKFCGALDYVLTATGRSPMAFFIAMGQHSKARGGMGGISLAGYAALFLEHCLTLDGVEEEKLRNAMVLDCLATDNTGRLPPCLHRQTPALRGELRRLALTPQYTREGWDQAAAQGRLGAALLEGESPRLAVADHRRAHPVSGRYPVVLLPLTEA